MIRPLLVRCLLLAWLISLLSYIFLLYVGVYESPENPGSFLYLFICLLCLCTGLYVKTPFIFSATKKQSSIIVTSRISKEIIFWGCIVSALFAFFSLQRTGFSGNIEDQRRLMTGGDIVIAKDIFYYIFDGFRAINLLAFSLVFWCNYNFRGKLVASICSFMAFVFYAIETGGRIHLLIPIIVFVANLYLRVGYGRVVGIYNSHTKHHRTKGNQSNKKGKTKRFLRIILLFLGLFTSVVIFGIWSIARESSVSDTSLTWSRLKPLISFYESLGLDVSLNIKFYLSYFTLHVVGALGNSIYNFDPFYNHYGENPLFGLYNFSFISSSILRLDWFSWKENIEITYDVVGRFRNVWGTYVREFIVDFSRFGAPLASFIFGVLIKFVFKNRYVSLPLTIMSSFNLTWLLMSIFYSSFIIRSYQMAYLIIIFWILISFLLIPYIRKKRSYFYTSSSL